MSKMLPYFSPQHYEIYKHNKAYFTVPSYFNHVPLTKSFVCVPEVTSIIYFRANALRVCHTVPSRKYCPILTRQSSLVYLIYIRRTLNTLIIIAREEKRARQIICESVCCHIKRFLVSHGLRYLPADRNSLPY